MTGVQTCALPIWSRVATSFVNTTRRFFESIGKKVEIVEVSGAAEIMPYMNVSDFIVDLVSSGSTLKTNRLVEIHPIIYSQAVAIANKESLKKHKDAIGDIINAIRSIMTAESKKYLMADIPKKQLEKVQSMFPGLAGPTVMNIAGRDDMVAIHVVIDAKDIYDAVNSLQKLGGKGILTLPIDRLVL